MDSLESRIDKLFGEKKPDMYCSLLATPLVEIFSVTVNADADVEIYGRISVSENEVHTLDIFHREEDNPQFVSPSGSLMLTAPLNANSAVIMPSELVTLDVELYDKANHCNLIVRGSVILNRVSSKDEDDWLEDYQIGRVPGVNNCNVQVHYAIFPYAVAATVNVLFFSKDNVLPRDGSDYFFPYDEDVLVERDDQMDVTNYDKHDFCGFANLYGTVSASGGIDGEVSNRTSLLFSKEESVRVKSGRFIELSRSVVAVPAYSSLQLQINLFNQSPIAGDAVEFKATVEFKARDRRNVKKDIVGDDGSRIRIVVSWSHEYRAFYGVCRLVSTPTKIKDRANEGALKVPKLSSDHSPSAGLSDNSVNCELDSSEDLSENFILPLSDFPKPVMELYSVVVRGKELEPFKFYGKGVVLDDFGPQYFFSEDELCLQYCPNFGMRMVVKGASHSFAAYDTLGMRLDLNDVRGDVISCGITTLNDIDQEFVANMRMCTVIRGDRCFTALHYSVFPDGVTAEVEIKLNGTSFPGIVRGTIYASHGNCATTMRYQEKLFKSILFHDVHKGERLDAPSSTLPLVKSVVSLPRRSFLIIEAKLSVSPLAQGDLVRSIERRVIVKCNGDPVQIREGDLVMEVSVNFSSPW